MERAHGAWEESGGDPGRRVPPVLVIALLVAAVVAVAVVLRGSGVGPQGGADLGPQGGSGLTVEAAEGAGRPSVRVETPTPRRGTAPAAPAAPGADDLYPVGGTWHHGPDAPLDFPNEYRGVWTGRELVAFDDAAVAAHDPDLPGTWRTLPPQPPWLTSDAQPLWTGSEVLLWNGTGVLDADVTGPDMDRIRGAALDPDTGVWRSLAPGPSLNCPHASGVWTGGEAVFWGGRCLEEAGEQAGGGAIYDAATDTWRATADAPLTPAVTRAVWTGAEVLFWGNREAARRDGDETVAGFTLAYDPARDRWRELRPPPLAVPSQATGVWTGEHLVLWGSRGVDDPRDAPPRGAVLRPEGATWSLTDPTVLPAAGSSMGFQAVWTGEAMIIAGGHPEALNLVHWPITGRFGRFSLIRPRAHGVAAWTGEALLLWGGYTESGPDVQLWTWRPDSDDLAEP